MVAFVAIFLGILLGAHALLWQRLVASPRWGRPLRLLLTALFLGGGLSIPLAFVGRYLSPDARLWSHAAYVWLGFFFYLLVFLGPAELLRVVVARRARARRRSEAAKATGASPGGAVASTRHGEMDLSRRRALQRLLAGGVAGAAGAVTGFGLYEVARGVDVARRQVSLRDLPAAFEGFTIVQLTDVHIGAILKGPWLEAVVARVNALRPDLIVLTGDLVDGSVPQLERHVAPLAKLSAPRGVFCVSGNHEYYSGVEPWMAHFAYLGITPLRNAHMTLREGEAALTLAGIEDLHASRFPNGKAPDLDAALAGYNRTEGGPLILLAHQPKAIHAAARAGVDLQISGHTHGGQLVPFNWLVYLDQPYIDGLHRHKDTWIYVSRGTGFWGPPMRVGAPAEITHLTLTRA